MDPALQPYDRPSSPALTSRHHRPTLPVTPATAPLRQRQDTREYGRLSRMRIV
jgi:hypothetical protein